MRTRSQSSDAQGRRYHSQHHPHARTDLLGAHKGQHRRTVSVQKRKKSYSNVLIFPIIVTGKAEEFRMILWSLVDIITFQMKQNPNNYKTSLCRHYTEKGHCSLFENCYFAHGQKELRQRADPLPFTPPPQLRPVSIYKTQLCKYFMKGYCRNDTDCPFAHGATDLHGMVVTPTLPVPPPPPLLTAPQQPPQPPPPARPNFGQAGSFLLSIFRNLEQVFPEEVTKKVLIKKGIQLVESGELPEANEIINELVSSNTLSDRQKEQCQTILSNAYTLHKINFIQF